MVIIFVLIVWNIISRVDIGLWNENSRSKNFVIQFKIMSRKTILLLVVEKVFQIKTMLFFKSRIFF